MALHTYWSLNITNNNGSTAIAIAELEIFSVIGGVNQCVGGTASATSFYPGYPASNAFFSHVDNNVWVSEDPVTFPQRLIYQFSSPIDALEYHVYVTNYQPEQPKSWTFDYSDDGINWTVADVIADHVFSTEVSQFLVPVTNPKLNIDLITGSIDTYVLNADLLAGRSVSEFLNLDLLIEIPTNLNLDLLTGIVETSVLNADLLIARPFIYTVDLMAGRSVSATINLDLESVITMMTGLNIDLITARQQYSVAELNIDLITEREINADSIVIDVHNPETPVYGSYE